MAATVEPNLSLTVAYALGEDNWHVGITAGLKKLGAVVHLSVTNLTTSAQPGSPTEGARYVIPAVHTWPSPAAANQVAVYANGAWSYYTPKTGWLLHNEADGTICRFTGSAWTIASGAIADGDKGDIVVSGSGSVWSIDSNVIVNADINSAAAIAYSKMASLTASRVLVSDSSGVLTVAAGLAYQTSSPNLTVTAQGAAHVALLVKGAASQSANLQEWQDSSGTVANRITAAGAITLGSGAASGGITIYSTSDEATNYQRGQIRVASNAFIIDAAKGGSATTPYHSYRINGTEVWSMDTQQAIFTARMLPNNDNTYDLGRPASLGSDLRWKTLYVGTSIGIGISAVPAAAIELGDAKNIAVGTSTGTKIGTATTQKLALWDATPVVQPSSTGETTGFTAGAGSAVLSDSTFTGNTGSKAYTIGDIVKHLKTVGILAAS